MHFQSSPRSTVTLVGFDPELPPGPLNLDRVLFLDFDGVLHPENGDPNMEFVFMQNFCDALRAADPNGEMPIVVTSMWRFTHTVQALRVHFPADIARQVVGVTPDLLDETPDPWAMVGGASSVSGSRQREVVAWMREFAPAAQWLAIDDRTGYFADDCPHLFAVPSWLNSGGTGLNSMVAEALRDRLVQFLTPDDASRHPGRPAAEGIR